MIRNALIMEFQNVFAPTTYDKSIKLMFVLAISLEMVLHLYMQN